MEVSLLGPFRVRREGEELQIGGHRQRAVLAALAINSNRNVARDRLINLVWGDDPPESAAGVLQTYIANLRKVLEPDGGPYKILVSRPAGYELCLPPNAIDAHRFTDSVRLGQEALRNRNPQDAESLFMNALSVWRGPALGEFERERFALPEARRLEELRLAAIEGRVEARLALGRHLELIPDLESLVEEHPLREHLHGQLMLSLYRAGRQAEATTLYHRTRKMLVEELGIEPGPELQKLLKQILNHDPALQLHPPAEVLTPAGAPTLDAPTLPGHEMEPHGLQPTSLRVDSAAKRERKTVSVLFCELAEPTAISQRKDPEDVQAQIMPYQERFRHELERFGGTVDRFTGDSVMAIFGAPVTHEDDPERAVRAGLSVLEALEELNAARPGSALSIRVGVATGEALVSLDVKSERGEALVLGQVVKRAALLQKATPINAIAVDENAFRATERLFVYQQLAAVTPQEGSEPMPSWRPLAPRARFGSDVPRTPATPFVGRELELRQLRTAFDRAVQERCVQLVTIVGEPGIGKSRLVGELFGQIESLEALVTWRQGRCLPYGEGIALWALGEIVKAHAGIFESDSVDEAKAKLEAALPEAGDRPWLRARLLPLIGVESIPAAQEEAFAAWRRFLELIADKGPAVIVFEDLHWADEALLSFLEYFADWAQAVPLLIVCTARPELLETRPSWGAGLTNQVVIRLQPLSDTETARLLSTLFQQAVLPAETQQRLIERSGGNPLYAEEFMRLLRDRRRIDQRGSLKPGVEVTLPQSLEALIAARLDTLPPQRKQLLQDAAVIGKVFWSGALAALGNHDPGELAAALHTLTRKELVRELRRTSMEGEAEYSFWHLLIRDVAYRQIPRAERAAKHVAAATWLEAKAGERIEDAADVLAYHTGEALALAQSSANTLPARELTAAAIKYAMMAGERALGLDAARAAELLRRARQITPASDARFPRVLRRWAEAARNTGRFAEAAGALEEAITAFERQGDMRGAGEALSVLSWTEHHLGKPGAIEMAERAVAMLDIDPGPELLDALGRLAHAEGIMGSASKAVTLAERGISIAERLRLPAPAHLLATHGFFRCYLGHLDGIAEVEAALELSIAEGEGREAARLHNNLAVVRHIVEGPASAAVQFEQAQAFAEARGLSEAANIIAVNRVNVLIELGRLRQALDQAEALSISLREGGDQLFLGIVRAYQAAVLAELGQDMRVPGDEALRLAQESDDPHLLAQATAATAATLLAKGKKAVVTDLFSRIVSADLRDNPEFSFDLPALGRAAAQLQDPELLPRLAPSITSKLPLQLHARMTVHALEMEVRGGYEQAAQLHLQAANGWAGFGNRLEEAHALLGAGRCLTKIQDPSAELSLRKARALFADMGARPRLAECDSLIYQTVTLSS